MIRVLHLLGVQADFQTRRTHESLHHHLAKEFITETRTLGRGGDFLNPISAIRQLRRSTADIIHAWGMRALTIAALSGAKRILFSPERFAGPKNLRWVRSIMNHLNVEMICATSTQQRVALENGIPSSRCHLIRPGVDFGRIRTRRDTALRAALGFSDNDYVVLAPGESTRSAAHDNAIWACGILHVLDPRYKLLLWGRGDQLLAARKMVERVQQPNMMKVAEHQLGRPVEFEELLPAADCCLITAKSPVSTLPIAMCMAAGMQIVSTVTSTVSELLEDRHTALMVSKSSPRLLAQRVLDLRADSNLQWSISDMARTEAYEFFPLTRLLNLYRTIYEQFGKDEPLNVIEPGAGLRFQGRA